MPARRSPLVALSVLSAAALAVLTGCASSTADTAPSATAAPGSDAPLAGESFVIAVSDDENPFGFTDEDGAFTGVTADLLAELADRLGFEYTTEATDFAAAIPGVQSGKYDFAFRQMGITAERIDILDLVAWKRDGVTFEKLQTSDVEIGEDFSGICGLTVGILQGEAQSEATLLGLSDDCVAAGDDAITISPFPDRATADLAVKSGRVDIATNSLGQFGLLLAAEPDVFAQTGPEFNPVFQGLGFPEGSELAEVFRDALNELIADGTYGEILAAYDVSDVAVEKSEIDIIAD